MSFVLFAILIWFYSITPDDKQMKVHSIERHNLHILNIERKHVKLRDY